MKIIIIKTYSEVNYEDEIIFCEEMISPIKFSLSFRTIITEVINNSNNN